MPVNAALATVNTITTTMGGKKYATPIEDIIYCVARRMSMSDYSFVPLFDSSIQDEETTGSFNYISVPLSDMHVNASVVGESVIIDGKVYGLKLCHGYSPYYMVIV